MGKYPERVTTTVSTELAEAIDKIAEENYVTQAAIARRALTEWVAAKSKDTSSD